MSLSLPSPNSDSRNKYSLASPRPLHYLVFVFTSILAMVSLSSNIDPSFAVLIEERDEYASGKIFDIGANNSDPLSTILNSQGAQDYTNRGNELGLAIAPNDTDALYNKGVDLLYTARQEEAITYFDKILSIKPDNFDALYYKGVALDSLGKYDEAIVYYDKALEVNPKDFYVLYHKGTALYNLNKYNEAVTSFDRALEVNPNDIDTLNGKGTSLSSLGNYEEAITNFDKVLEIDPSNVYAGGQKEIASKVMDNSESSITYVQASTSDLDEQTSTTADNTLSSFSDSKTKVSFQYPSDWEVASDEYIESAYGDSEGFIVLMVPKSLDGSSISVIYEELPFSISPKEYVNIAKKSLLEEKDTSVSKTIPISIGSLDGYKYNVTISDETLPEGEYVSTQIAFVKNSKAFVITYSLGAGMTEDFEDIESMIESFEINNSNKDNDNTEDDNKTENDVSLPLPNEKELGNAKEKGKGVLTNIFNSLFPQTGEKFSNSIYGVDIAFPKNWTGFQMKIVFPMAIVTPEGFNITGIFSVYADSIVDNLAETILSADGKELSEQELRELFEPKVQESAQVLTEDLMKYMGDKTSGMGVFIYDKEFARLVNSIDPNNTKSSDSLTSIYEQLATSDPAINCERKTLEFITLNSNISAEMSTEQCSYTDGNKNENNLNYFVLTPDAIVGIQYASDADKENEKFRAEFDEALKTLSVEESLPINNHTIQQFLKS